MFNVIKFVEREKGGYLIPLNNVNDRIKSILGISMSSVERLKREMREQEREMLEKQNELIQLQKKLDQEKQDKEDTAIRATLRLRNPRTRSSSSSSSSSVTAAFNFTLTTFMPVAKSSQKRGHFGRPPIILTENQKENVRDTGAGRLRQSSGKGSRLVISALMSNSGFHRSSIDIFETTEGNRMDSSHFLAWIDRTASLLRKEFVPGDSTSGTSLIMPPKKGGTNLSKQGQNLVNGENVIQGQTAVADVGGTMTMSHGPRTKALAEGVKLNKLQLNDVIKQHLKDLRISDIQLSRAGIFTLYATDVSSFNRLLNELTPILATNGQATAKIYVPRSIQRIKDTEKVAFVKNVDIEIPESRITEALKDVGLDAIDVVRLTNKVKNFPTRTIKITFIDPQNRNTFVHTGLQVDSMHFIAEPANQNTKPVQCYICLKYNHVAKYCKTKQQICARCGENHRIDQCTAASHALKCCNCKGSHLATSIECATFKEQAKRIQNLVYQYSSTSKPITTAPAIHDLNEFPSLPNIFQRQQDHLHHKLFDEIINALSSKMEKIIEETTSRLFKKLQQKIKKIEKSIGTHDNNQEDASTVSDSDSNEEGQVVKHIKNKQKQNTQTSKTTTSSIDTSSKPTTTSNTTSSKPPQKQKEASKNDRVGKLGGGVLLAVKQHIKCREVLNKTSQMNEIIAIEVETQLFKSILIASIYVPPTAKMDLNIFQELYNINNNCIIVGDLNATLHHMGSAKGNARGRQLQELFKEGFIEGVDDDTPTFEKNDYEVKLDWLLGSQPLLSFTSNVETHPPIGTSCGHKPLTFDISIGAESKPASPRISFNFKAAKWSKFRSKLDQQLMLWNNDRRLDSALDIEKYTSFITNSILVATQEAIPLSKQTNTRPMISEVTK
ncbi:unnamed protein product, partial [Rotaria sordida]